MNLEIGLSNGAVQNVIIDDPLVNKIHIAVQIVPDNYIYWFSLKNNSTDYPFLTTYHYNYSNLGFPYDRQEQKVGYNSYEIKRKDNVVSLILTFYDRTYLDRYIGTVAIMTETFARRIMMRFFIDCDISDVVWNAQDKQWQGNLVTIGELFKNQKVIADQIVSLGQQIDTNKADIYTNRNVLDTVQRDLRTANKNIINVSNDLAQEKETTKSQANELVKLDLAVSILLEAEKQIARDDTALIEAVGKIQTFLSNIQIATSDSKKFIKYNPSKITVPPKDLLYEITQVQQKLESIKDEVNKMNNVQLTKVVNYKHKYNKNAQVAQVQQKLESIKDEVNKMNNVQLTKVVNYKPTNTFKF